MGGIAAGKLDDHRIITFDGVYNMMQAKRDQMYAEKTTAVTFNQAEFFALYKLVCHVMQIKHITEEWI